MPIEKTKPAPLLSALAAAETTTSGVWEPPALSTIDGVAAAMSVVLSGRVLTALIGMLLAAKEREYGPSGCARVGRRRVLAKARAMGLNATIVVDVVRGGLCCSVVGVDCLVYALGTTEVVGCLWIYTKGGPHFAASPSPLASNVPCVQSSHVCQLGSF